MFPHQIVPLVDRELTEERMRLAADGRPPLPDESLDEIDHVLLFFLEIAIAPDHKVRVGGKVLLEWLGANNLFLRNATHQHSHQASFQLHLTEGGTQRSGAMGEHLAGLHCTPLWGRRWRERTNSPDNGGIV